MPLILVVDDESAIVETLTEALRWSGHEVLTAANGKAAIEVLKGKRPDIVLLDYMMPIFDGVQTLTAIRADERLRSIRVVFMSPAPEETIRATVKWDAFLSKPFRESALLDVLGKVSGGGGGNG
jgi:CheY-like chemotaxis protein